MKYIGQHIFDYVASFRQNVGIGTDSPSYPLEVVGNIFTKGHIFSVGDNFAIEIDGTDSGGPRMHIGFDHDTDGFITFGAYNNINNLDTKSRDFHLFGNNTTTGFYFDESAGKFGIGTVTPDQKLDVQGNIQISNTDASDGDTIGYLNFHNTTGGSSGNHARISAIRDSNSAGQLVFHTKIGGGDHERARISSEGFLGIGLTNPTEKLHVSGNAIITGNLTVSGTTTTINTANLNVEDKNITLNYSTGDSSSTADGAGITIQDAVDSSNDATILWDATNDEFDFSHGATFSGTVNFGVDGTGVDVKFFGDTSGRDMFWLQAQDALILKDNTELRIGSGYDLRLSHDGSHSRVKNYNGDLYITQRQDDGDIILQSDDGSGGTTEYFRLDGGVGYMIASKAIRALDSVNLQLGASADFTMQHNGTKTLLQNFTGNLEIIQNVDDGDIFFKSDDGSGGVATYMQIDGSHSRVIFPNNVKAAFGSSSRFVIFHDGTDAFMRETVGDLIIQQLADDKDIVFKCDDGSGGTTTYLMLDGSATTAIFKVDAFLNDSGNYIYSDISDNSLKFADNTTLKIGTGNDLQLLHDGSNSHIVNYGGDLKITQNANDKDIIFNCDDGSGGNTAYITLDGSLTRTIANQHLQMADGKALYVGAGSDAGFYHLSGHNYIENNTGDLNIVQNTDDGDIVFKSDNGSGGTTDYVRIDGANSVVTFSKDFKAGDNVKANFGAGSDLKIYHFGTGSIIENETGPLQIKQDANDEDIQFFADDGSGGMTEYFKLDGSIERNVFSKDVNFGDGISARFNGDLRLRSTGGNQYITSQGSNDLYIQQTTDDKDIIFQSDNGSGGVIEYLRLDGSHERLTVNSPNGVVFFDNIKANFGTDSDLQIYHDGSNSYIDETGTGVLVIGSSQTNFQVGGANKMIIGTNDITILDNIGLDVGTGGDFQIKHDGSNTLVESITGHLYFYQKADDSDISFFCDDGSGGNTEYFRIDGGGGFMVGSKSLYMLDDNRLYIGSAGDMELNHNGTNSFIYNHTGNLTIQNNTDDGDIIFRGDDGSGGTTIYFRVDGSIVHTSFLKPTLHNDNVKASFGDAPDLHIYHDGTNSYIQNETGQLYILNKADNKDIEFQSDDGNGGLATYFKLDGSLAAHDGSSSTALYTAFPDNSLAAFGDSQDLVMYHSGSHSLIRHLGTGNLYIDNTTDDAKIFFRNDDGSGGLTTYIEIQGDNTRTVFRKDLNLQDTVNLYLGTSSDLRLIHDGADSAISNATGNLVITNEADDKDIIFKCDDGSGGLTEYLRLDGGFSSPQIKIPDNVQMNFGAGLDLRIIHDGFDSYISSNGTGHLYIRQLNDDKDIIFQSDNGSGGLTNYLKIDGDNTNIQVSKNLYAFDNVKIAVGDSLDLQIYHNGSNSFISQNGNGHLYIENNTDDQDIIFRCDDGSGGVTTYFQLDGSSATNIFSKDVLLTDSISLKIGSAADLKIYHDGSHSYIKDNGTGNLRIDATNLHFRNADGSKLYASGIDGGAFSLRHNNVTKLATSADGVDITGNLTVSTSSTSSGIYAQFINLKGFCTLAANYQFAEDLEDTKSPFEMAVDYGSATISSSTEINQSNLFRASGFHVPVACSVNAINMQLTCNNTGNVTIAVVEYRPSEAGTDQVDHPRTIYEEVVVASNNNNNKVKTVTVATADLDNTAIPAGSHIMIMAKGDSDSVGGKAFISAAIEIKW